MIKEVEEKFEIRKNRIVLYTDGSKREGGISAESSIWIEGRKEGYYYISIEKKSSIMTAELVAIWKALEIAGDEEDKDVIIWADSQSAIQAIDNNSISVYRNEYMIKIRKKIEEIV